MSAGKPLVWMWPLAGMPKIQTCQVSWPSDLHIQRSFLSRNKPFSSGFWSDTHTLTNSNKHTHTHTHSPYAGVSLCSVCFLFFSFFFFFLYGPFAIYLKWKIFLLKGCLTVLWKPWTSRLLNNPWLCPSSDYFSERDHKTSWKSPEAFRVPSDHRGPFSPVFLKCHGLPDQYQRKCCMHEDLKQQKKGNKRNLELIWGKWKFICGLWVIWGVLYHSVSLTRWLWGIF